MRQCPFCGEDPGANPTYCRHCHHAIPSSYSTPSRGEGESDDSWIVHYQNGIQSLKDHDYESATFHLKLAASLRPDSIDTLLGLTTAYSKQGKHAEAIRISDSIIRMDGFNKTAWLQKAENLYYLSKYQDASQLTLQEALVAVNRYLQVDTSNPESWYLRGLILARMGNPGEAVKSFDGALALNPDHGDARFQRDQCRPARGGAAGSESSSSPQGSNPIFGHGNNSHSPPPSKPATLNITLLAISIVALLCIAGAVVLLIPPPVSPVTELMNQGLTLQNQVRYEEAIGKFDAVIELQPDHFYAWYNKGWCLEQMQRYEEALRALDKALAINPDSKDAWIDRGFSSFKMGRYDAALFSAEKAIALDDQYGLAWYNKAGSLQALGRYDEARTALDRSKDLGYDPASPNS